MPQTDWPVGSHKAPWNGLGVEHPLLLGWGQGPGDMGLTQLLFTLFLYMSFLSFSSFRCMFPACWLEGILILRTFSLLSPCTHPFLANSHWRAGPQSSTWRGHPGSRATDSLGWRPPWPAREIPGSQVSVLLVPGGFQEGCGTVLQKTDQGLSWDATDVYECARRWG